MKHLTQLILIALLLAPPAALYAADLKLSGIFADHMVLQCDKPVTVWGWADSGEQVTVSFVGQKKQVTADATGKWLVKLDPLTASTEPRTLTVRGKKSIALTDILVGEVWLCAGDATMATPIEKMRAHRSEAGEKSFPNVHCFVLPQVSSPEPQSDTAGAWVGCDRKTAGTLPALPYFFAKELSERQKVPVGVIVAAHDLALHVLRGGRVQGVPIESFLSRPALLAESAAAPIFDYYKSGQELRTAFTAFNDDLANWKLRHGKALGAELRELDKREPDVLYNYVEEMKKAGKTAPPPPPEKPTAKTLVRAPTHAANLYNGMIAPIAGCAIRGIAWGQGAANAPRATQYRKLLPALIRDWRRAWGGEELPFVFLQQPRVENAGMDPRTWAELREAQALAQTEPRTAMAMTTDWPRSDSPLPLDLRGPAARLALTARGLVYGDPVTCTGPVAGRIAVEGRQIIVEFGHTGGRLAPRDGAVVKGFAIAEHPNRWVYADARIDGNRVIVSHPKVAAPIAVRYDWVVENDAEGNLVNHEGLPAIPFRSDDWPAFTDLPAAFKPNAWAQIQNVDLYPVVDPALPRVLLIGDSIMGGYGPLVVEMLRGKANVNRQVSGTSPGNAAKSVDSQWHINEGDYAVIHYNDGLHSMPPRETDAQFEAGLREVLLALKKDCSHVIWATITPAPDGKNTLGPDSWNASVLSRNALSKRIAAETGITVNDLYELVIGRREQLQGFANLHFTPEGSKVMAEQVAATILEALKQGERDTKGKP